MLTRIRHPPLNRPVRAIAGEYLYTAEKVLSLGEKFVLYFLGLAVMESACCGSAGVSFARVAGIVFPSVGVASTDEVRTTLGTPITSRSLQRVVRREIMRLESVQQVVFDHPAPNK